MHKNLRRFSFFVSFTFFFASPAFPTFAAWVWSPESGKFVNTDATVQETPQKQYEYAMTFYKKKDLKEAQDQLQLLLRKYPGSSIAPEGQYQLGVIYEEMGDYYRAFQVYRDLLQKYPQSERVDEALEREFRIGNLFLSGKRGKLFGLDILPSGPKAIEIFKHIVETAPFSEYGDEAQFHLGLAYKKSGRFSESIQAFQTLIDQYPDSPFRSQARFQIADTSYIQSVTATRDQRSMDQAAREIDQFLKHHPDSNISEKAAKLRQEIDEKNAEKNYRIALFYEKENYLDSAFVYYRDVVSRYPHTEWGHKAKQRLAALEKPAEFLKSQASQVAVKKQQLEEALRTVGNADPVRKKELEEDLKRIKKQAKEVEKAKERTLEQRRSALHQKEKALQEKFKTLELKRKRFGKNLSEDLGQAFDRWQSVLEKEKAELAKERLQIKEWEKSLGVDTTSIFTDMISSIGKEDLSPLEEVHQLQAKRLGELIQEESLLLREKERLYLEYEKFLAEAGAFQNEEVSYQNEREKLRTSAQEIERLENELFEKERLYKKHFGISPWGAAWRAPKAIMEYSVDALNPFDRPASRDWESKSVKELRGIEKEWRERIATQKRVVEAVAQAFDKELAALDKKRVPVAEITRSDTDVSSVRRSIKQMEREIRSRYNEIQDRNKRKNQLVEELDQALQESKGPGGGRASKAGGILTAVPRGLRSFIFGLPEKDVQLTEEAKRLSARGNEPSRIQELRKNIELESLLIDTRNQEIQAMQRELEALRAQSSLAGSPYRRSILGKFPYVLVKEAVRSANRLVPKENREDALIKKLNEETEKLETLKAELSQIENLINKKSREPAPETAPKDSDKPLSQGEAARVPLPDQAVLRAEIESLKKQIEFKEQNYKQEEERLEKLRWERISKGRHRARAQKLRGIEKKLAELIVKQQRVYREEAELLDTKKQMIQKFLNQLPHDVFTEELKLERQAIESRRTELERRGTALGEELKRLQI